MIAIGAELRAEDAPWLAAMAETPQNPEYHAEGDVLAHTRMVCDALISAPGWDELDAVTREELWLAAVLHDVGKPATTRFEDGRWTAPGHARRGAIIARRLLWEAGVEPRARERICALVRHHMAPYHLIAQRDAVRRCVQISLEAGVVRQHRLTRADALGRIGSGVDALVLNVDLFAEYAAELGCLYEPYPFASDHARFTYFTRTDRDPAYAAYDDTRSRVVVLSGLPGAGKDLWIAHHGDGRPVISLDDLRRERGVKRGDTTAEGHLIQDAREQARVYLRAGEPFIWNATNLSAQLRGQTIALCADYHAHVTIVAVEAAADDLSRRNRDREHPVPWPSIERMLDRWEAPTPAECHRLEVWSDTLDGVSAP
ncbi:putative nucleotidyltransferase with HDIG domain [Solirubrobacter pauli]|uniref:Putative nucleotidyltransferase with HDIG domain n=1 Tax=Solirubrobacter pauli TaxID=166793 RepID=A0A660L699_9ACTN|nr:AAA family ATPase [Solirubrobacter pauli]RKQ90582.1 putative nucleotidyltransferase with HDIG domain [Solirubrobacter pauli]